MRSVYNRSFTRKWTTGDSTTVLAEKVDPGMILHVHQCFAYAPERDANDDIVIGIRNGGGDIYLFAVAPAAAQKGAEVANHFIVGEGDQIFATFEDVENNDTIGININGELVPLKEWIKYGSP